MFVTTHLFILVEDKMCQFCNDNSVENELHILLNCRVCDDLYSRAKEHDELFSEMQYSDKYAYLFSQSM
jgi:hypothetical protein